MKFFIPNRTHLLRLFIFCLLGVISYSAHSQVPGNDQCNNPDTLYSSTSCNNVSGVFEGATATALIGAHCGSALSGDVWFVFTAQTAYPEIRLSGMGSNLDGAPRLQILTTNCAGTYTNLNCVSGTNVTSLTLPTTAVNAGAGLVVGQQYWVRIFTGGAAPHTAGAASTWAYNICIVDRSPGRCEQSKSYVNITRGSTGGTVQTGDTLEMRGTFVVYSQAADSIGFYDTLKAGAGLRLVPGSIMLRTNEGKQYLAFTDTDADLDAGHRTAVSGDTAILMHLGGGAHKNRRGKLRLNSRPVVYGSPCIVMATYRVVVYATYGTKIRFGGGRYHYRDSATGVFYNRVFKNDSFIVYQSPGLCPNAVSVSNAVGVESNGTFGADSTVPIARNRTTGTPYTPTYTLYPFFPGGGPQDYYYGIVNNTSARYSTVQTWAKPDASSPSFRVFSLIDVAGDHTGAANPARGNPPCDTTLPVSASNPCGYMMFINSAYRTDTVFQYTVSGLCPNTYYEISAWFKNMCYKCGCDSLGRGATAAGYIPFAPGDSSGVQPNVAFDINGTDYYTTGNIAYVGLGVGPRGSDTANRWVKRGFVYLTGLTETGFTLTLRNNAPGGGGNDWALDDITVATCLPNMQYSPSTNPTICQNNSITVNDTIRSFFNNYQHYKWQRSTDGGNTWTDVTAPASQSPTLVGGAWQYITSYTIPTANATLANNGDQYRVVVATTSSNLANTDCNVTDGVSIITVNVIDCGVPFNTEMIQFSGKLVNNHASLKWTTSREDEPVKYEIERSTDGSNFNLIGTVNGHNSGAETNNYSFTDPSPVSGKYYYRVVIVNANGKKKHSRTISLSNASLQSFNLTGIINPFSKVLEFEVTMPDNERLTVELLDLFGKPVRKHTYNVIAGVNSLYFHDMESLPPGMYVFLVKSQNKTISRKVIKK